MISHKYRCIFIHIPKCAGTSIESALGHRDHYNGRNGQDHRSIRMIESPLLTKEMFHSQENRLEVLRRIKYKFHKQGNPCNCYTVTKEQFDSYFKFTFIRNPWSRAYSWYKNVMQDEIHRKGYKIRGQVSLNEFLSRFAGRGMLRPQTYWIKGFDGSIPLNHIGRFETLREDFLEICNCMHVPPIELPHKVSGSGEDYHVYYDQVSKDLIARIYREEIEMFGYSFEL